VKDSNFPLSIQASIILGSLIIAVSILVAGGAINLPKKAGSATTAAVTASTAPVPIPSGNPKVAGVTAGDLPTLGDNNAKVLVVEFADYQCPFCEKFFTDSMPQIKKDYIDTGKIKFAFRDSAFLGQESNDSANAARCANDQGKFWDFHDYLYTHQGAENSGAFSKDNLKSFGAAVGLNTSQFNQCIDSGKYATAVTNDTTAGKNLAVDGTPTVFINGTKLVGAQPYAVFKAAIDQELAAAK
jgi:protein-disulfide isomerase